MRRPKLDYRAWQWAYWSLFAIAVLSFVVTAADITHRNAWSGNVDLLTWNVTSVTFILNITCLVLFFPCIFIFVWQRDKVRKAETRPFVEAILREAGFYDDPRLSKTQPPKRPHLRLVPRE